LIWSQAAVGGPAGGSGPSAAGAAAAAEAARPAGEALSEAEFAALYRQLAAPLAAYARRTLGDAEEAHDVVQETFYRYLRAELPAGTDPETARPYLYRTASHLMRDRWRRGTRERRWREAHPEPRPAAPRDRTQASDLDRALGCLKPRDRALLWLAHVEGASHREIADTLAVGEASVRVMLFRARKRLEAVLAESGFTPEER
jgi:RNA polymerase sigma-70 factor (ECF subfamily)